MGKRERGSEYRANRCTGRKSEGSTTENFPATSQAVYAQSYEILRQSGELCSWDTDACNILKDQGLPACDSHVTVVIVM